MSINKKIWFSMFIILILVASSYAIEYTVKSHGIKSASIMKINYNSTPQALMDSGVLKKLPQSSTDKNLNEGPSLSTVLTSAGIPNYTKVSIWGLNEDSSQTINSSQIDSNLIFYFTDHGTVSLGIKGVPPHFLVEDVTEINAMN